MYPHRIRLRGPWTCQPLFRFVPGPAADWHRSRENLPPPFRMRMPGRWSDGGLHDFRGAVNCLRPFGYPGRIDKSERVWLTFLGLDGNAAVVLNDQLVGNIDGGPGPTEFEVTALLRQRNVLAVELQARRT